MTVPAVATTKSFSDPSLKTGGGGKHRGARRTASVIALRYVIRVEDLVVIRRPKRIRVPRAEGEVAFQIRFQPGEREGREKRRRAILTHARDEVREAGRLAAVATVQSQLRCWNVRSGKRTYVSGSGIAMTTSYALA